MTVYFQHVGGQNSARDFPRTIGVGNDVRKFTPSDLGQFSSLIPVGLSDFQVWGIPGGAAGVHEHLQIGDWFLLASSLGDEGGVEYVGKVVHILQGRQSELSKRLWTEDRFPWVFMLKGEMRHVPWPQFLSRIGYAANFDPRGHTFGISRQKMSSKGYVTDFDLIRSVLGES